MSDDQDAAGVPRDDRSDADAAAQSKHPHRGPEQLAGRHTTYDPEKPDIAEEHNSLSLAGELPGGPEHVEEPESPRGLAGLEPDWPESDTG